MAVSRRGAGNAPTVLLAHGFGQTRHAWEATATALAEAGYQALSFDARGHGDSSINPASLPYSAAQFTDDLIVLAGELPEPPVLVAASMGGLFGLLAEARWPGLFRAIVLVDITPRWDTTGVERILRFMTAHPQGLRRWMRPPMQLPHICRSARARVRRNCSCCCASAATGNGIGIGIRAWSANWRARIARRSNRH